MVKLNWSEEFVIYLIVAVTMVFFVEKIGFNIFNFWFSIIFWIILYSIISDIIVKAIRRKDEREPFKKLWKKQNISEKVFMIINIIVVLIFLMIVIGFVSDSLFYDGYDKRIGETNENTRKLIKIHIELLEEEGYEVLYFGDLFDSAYIKMKTLGRRQEQVRSGLSSLSLVYPNASEYIIRILEKNQECYYFIDGEIYRGDDRYNQINQMIASTSCD